MNGDTAALTPTVAFIDNPFGTIIVPPVPVRLGMPIRATYPPGLKQHAHVMLRVNNEWLLRADWESHVRPGDKIEWHLCFPQGGNASRAVLQIVAFIIIAYFTAGIGNIFIQAAARIALGLAASALINALVPPSKSGAGGNAASPSSVYNVQVSGNQARLNAPIPVLYGRNLTYPDFATQPYSEYSNNDQYYNVIFCLGQGYFSIERLQIDDTNFSAFSDIWYKVLEPGVKPTRVLPNVVTAPEVVDQDLTKTIRVEGSDSIYENPYVGGFAASGPQSMATDIGLDFEFPRGLTNYDSDGDLDPFTVNIQVECQLIDDFGAALGSWAVLSSLALTGKSTTPQRYSRKIPLPTPGRYLIRVIRASEYSHRQNDLNECHWTGLRAYLAYDPAEIFEPTATHIEMRVRANQQISQLTQRKIGVIATRKLRSWTPDDGWSVDVAATRDIAPAIMDMWSDATYGSGLDDSRIDLATLYALHLVWQERQDRLDIVFDSKVTAWDAAKSVCQVGRATPFRRYGVCTLARDQSQELPVTSFNSRNIRPNSVSIGYALATEVTADAVIIEYFSNRIWDWVQIECLAPGVTVATNKVISRLAGITGSKHALREGTYMAAVNMYRRKFFSWETEMQGLLPCYADKILLAPVLAQWATVGDVVLWDSGTLTVTLSEPVVFTSSAQDVRFQRRNGSLTNAIAVSSGSTPNEIILAAYPDDNADFPFVTSSASEQRTKFVFGAGVTVLGAARLLGITKRERNEDNVQYIQMSAVNEDERVHTVDLAYLPAPGEIQDPVPTGEVDGEAPDVPTSSLPYGVAVLSSRTVEAFNSAYDNPTDGPPRPSITITFHTDGSLTWSNVNGASLPTNSSTTVSGEWNRNVIDATVAATYDVRMTIMNAFMVPTIVAGPASGAWTPISSNVTWTFDDSTYEDKGHLVLSNVLKFEIRWGGVVQETAYYSLYIWLQPFADFGSAGADSGAGKVICTAMNEMYGLPPFANLVWLAYARKHLTPAHEVGYHRVFKPLVAFAFRGGNSRIRVVVRGCLEWVALARTADIRAQFRGTNPRPVYRLIRRSTEVLLGLLGRMFLKGDKK